MDGALTFDGAEGSFDMRLTQASESDDGVTFIAGYYLYLYTLNYSIDAGMPMPMKIVMDGGQSGAQYTFWNDGTVDVGSSGLGDSSISVEAEFLGMALPFSSADFAMFSEPGLIGTYECVGSSSLTMTLQADVAQTDNPVYQLVFSRAD